MDPSSSAALGLDDVTTDKINALMNNYERLLEAQLLDQQLYFEKLLARETVHALELSYMPAPSVEKSSTVSANKKNKAPTKKASFGEPSTSAATEEKNDDISPPVTTEDAAYSAAGTTLLTDSLTYKEASSAVQNPEVVQYMNEVEQLKMEISTVEMQYREVLEKVKKADEATRGLKKTNDALLKGQQALVRVCVYCFRCLHIIIVVTQKHAISYLCLVFVIIVYQLVGTIYRKKKKSS